MVAYYSGVLPPPPAPYPPALTSLAPLFGSYNSSKVARITDDDDSATIPNYHFLGVLISLSVCVLVIP